MTINFAEFRRNLATVLDEVTGSRAPLEVTRGNIKEAVVVLSKREFTGWEETMHLLSNELNIAYMARGLAAYAAGEFIEVDESDL